MIEFGPAFATVGHCLVTNRDRCGDAAGEDVLMAKSSANDRGDATNLRRLACVEFQTSASHGGHSMGLTGVSIFQRAQIDFSFFQRSATVPI